VPGGDFVDEQDAVPEVVGVEQRGCQGVATAVTLTDLGVEEDAHPSSQPAGLNSIGRVSNERSPGV